MLRQLLAEPDRYYIQPTLWLPDEILPVLTVAQHYGIPTCLLDWWSRRAFVASHFAASGAIRGTSESSRFAV